MLPTTTSMNGMSRKMLLFSKGALCRTGSRKLVTVHTAMQQQIKDKNPEILTDHAKPTRAKSC